MSHSRTASTRAWSTGLSAARSNRATSWAVSAQLSGAASPHSKMAVVKKHGSLALSSSCTRLSSSSLRKDMLDSRARSTASTGEVNPPSSSPAPSACSFVRRPLPS